MDQDFAQLGHVRFGLGGQHLLVGAHAVRRRHQGGALLGQGVLDDPSLIADTQAGGLQPRHLPGQILGGHAGGVSGLAGGGGQVGGAGGQGGFGFADLGLGQIRGLGDHAALAGDGVGDAGGLPIQDSGHLGHPFALAAEAVGQQAGRAAGALGGLDQPLAFHGQDFAQGQQLVAGALGRAGGVLDFLAHLLGGRTHAAGGQGGGLDQAVGQGLGAPGFGG